MLAHHQVCRRKPNIFGAHNFERFGIFQHSILMDATFMGKGILAHNGFVELYRKPRNRSHAARNIHQFRTVDIGKIGHDIAAHF